MKYLVDTNILIFLMNSKSQKLQQRFTRKRPESFGISSITCAELIYGAKKSAKVEQNLNAAIKVMASFEIIDFTGLDAFEYGDIRASLELKGTPISGNDLLIAAQARRLRLIVITNNTKEFTRVGHLKVEDWTK